MCADNTLYCGYTNDVEKRLTKHNAGKGAKYTRTRLPVKLLFVNGYNTKSEAMKDEYAFKQLSREKKLELIKVIEKRERDLWIACNTPGHH
jgi:putative endonuclease